MSTARSKRCQASGSSSGSCFGGDLAILESDDSWIAAVTKATGFEPDRFHALGVVNYRWQQAEHILRFFTIFLADIEITKARAIVHDIGDIALSNSIHELLRQNKTLSKDFREATVYALKIYDINRINRNQLSHFLPMPAGSTVTLRRMKGPRFNPQTIQASVEDIRRVADDIVILTKFLRGLSHILSALNVQHPPPALPDKPPLPEMLWKPPPQGQP